MKTALPFRIFIPTCGRTASQITVSKLPAFLHKNITLVCPAGEVEMLRANYPTVEVRKQPSRITTIAEKRGWIATVLAKKYDEPFWFQADDDLSFYVFDTRISKHRACNSENVDFQKAFWKTMMPSLCETYDSVGIGTKAFALPGGVKENYHLGFFFGMNQDATSKLEWNRIPLYEDIDYTLQLLKNGLKIGVTYDLSLSQRAAGAEGGIALANERKRKDVAAALDRLIELHPECVKRKATSGQHEMSNTRISWQTAVKIGELKSQARKSLF